MTLYEIHALLTHVYPNYELRITWTFVKSGNSYKAEWRPEGKLHDPDVGHALLSEFPAVAEGRNLSAVLDEVMDKAVEFKSELEEYAANKINGGEQPNGG